MTIAEYKEHVISDYESPAWELLERVVEKLGERGIEPDAINGWHVQDFGKGKVMDIETVYHHNGASDNVTVRMTVAEFEPTGRGGWFKGLIDVRVPKNASDRVINNRIDKIIEVLR